MKLDNLLYERVKKFNAPLSPKDIIEMMYEIVQLDWFICNPDNELDYSGTINLPAVLSLLQDKLIDEDLTRMINDPEVELEENFDFITISSAIAGALGRYSDSVNFTKAQRFTKTIH